MICGFNGCTHELGFKMSLDPDEGHCIVHGPRYVNTPLDIPLLYTKEEPKPEYKCIDCGQPVSGRDTKRCRPCLGKYFSEHPTGVAARKSPVKNRAFGEQPIVSPRHDYVVSKSWSGL